LPISSSKAAGKGRVASAPSCAVAKGVGLLGRGRVSCKRAEREHAAALSWELQDFRLAGLQLTVGAAGKACCIP